MAERTASPGLPAPFLVELPPFAPQPRPEPLGPPAQDIVHLWCFTLPTLAEIDVDLVLLGAQERARFDAFRAPSARQQFAACRIALRHLLSAYLGLPPQSFAISCVPGEKPILHAPAPLEFSYSHAGHRAAIAFVEGGTVGVDLEAPDPTRDYEGIARRYFHREELGFYEAGAAETQQERFLRVWTAKEAILKASGEGLRGLERASLAGVGETGLRLHAWRLPDGHVISLAAPINCNIHNFNVFNVGEQARLPEGRL